MELENRIQDILDTAVSVCHRYISSDDAGALHFIDPNEKVEISAHYGNTHFAVALIIIGRKQSDKENYDIGVSLLESIVDKWHTSIKLREYHFDFNNFALTVAIDYLNDTEGDLKKRIQEIVLDTGDSRHDTINWLPMRAYVNQQRYGWTNEPKFQAAVDRAYKLINQATNKDAGIEDRLPKGVSYNLQYNISTVAILQFINCRGGDVALSNELGFLLDKVLPDADINYQGRGTNQIYAWAMWIYLLASSGQFDELKRALDFVEDKYKVAIKNDNLMLNEWHGTEKYLWWDYHYSSVYLAHSVFWLALAIDDYSSNQIDAIKLANDDTGLISINNSKFSAISFTGRSGYLAEYGPILSALFHHKHGCIFKATFGPWQGQFGNKYFLEDVTLRNFLGLIEVRVNRNEPNRSIVKKLLSFTKIKPEVRLKPFLADFEINAHDEFSITFNNPDNKRLILNIPVLKDARSIPSFKLLIDGELADLKCNLSYRNQYGWCDQYQSKSSCASKWTLTIQ